MLKKSITFKDLDGNDLTEDFYFNVSKAEIAELELSQKGGLSEHLKAIVEAEDGAEIMSTFRRIIQMSVGIRSEDGRRFVKNDEIRNDFMQTEAYSVLFMELVTDADKGSEFIRGIMPADLAAQIEAGAPVTDFALPKDDELPAWIREDREPNEKELTGMSKQELQMAFRMREERRASQKNPG